MQKEIITEPDSGIRDISHNIEEIWKYLSV